MNRREWTKVALSTMAMGWLAAQRSIAADSPHRKFTLDLCPGRLGVQVDQRKAIELAAQFGFESVEPMGLELAKQSVEESRALRALMQNKKVTWGAAGLTVDFRKDDASFESGCRELPSVALALQQAGATRVGTWLSPAHEELTYRANFQQHALRLRQVATILGDHGLRLGLEYVGPRRSRASKRYAFIHTLTETQELLAEIARDNVGLVLDSWHWYTAEEQVADLEGLTNKQIVAVDLNDAPSGVAVADQIDNRRELPCATGVIDVKSFLTALVKLGYDGPIRAEPFSQTLNALDDTPAVEATAKAMKQAFALVD